MPISPTRAAQRLGELVAGELPALKRFRHDLHAHPELKYEENRTSRVVRDALAAAGIEHVGGLAGGTGVLACIRGANDGGAIGLRADMDALPITEENEVEYVSTNPGVMHACGHDGHTTICLGAARILKRLADEGGLPRSVKFLFQPAEEGGAGGKRMVEDGCLTDKVLGPRVEEMFGLHCWPTLPLGTLATRPGPLLAATDHFTVTMRGKMGHAASPHFSHDPIVAAAEAVMALQAIVSRNVDPLESMVISVTKIHAGTAYNVIPEAVEFAGTLRTLTDEMRRFGRTRFYETVINVAAIHRCVAEIEWEPGYPVTRNDAGAVEVFFRVARKAVGEEKATLYPVPCMGGEDFSYYCNEVPSCFFLLGQQRRPDEPYPMVHTPRFDFNDDSLALGVEMFCRLALGIGRDG